MERKAQYPINELFLKRHSPRAMSAKPIKDEELFSLFEAARWAPSSSNEQPWRIIYAKRDTPSWEKLFNLLVDFNKLWAKNASALLVFISKETRTKDNTSNITHSFDAGSAWENLALQASLMGIIAHGMAGFDYERAKSDLKIPSGYRVEAMVAIGYPADKGVLPERMQKGEELSGRNPIESFCFEGKFKEKN